MWQTLKRLSLGLATIALTSAVLLVTDNNFRKGSQPAHAAVPRVAIFQHASQSILDDGVAGMVDGLAESGFVDGETVSIQPFNAQGDVATANAIAQGIVGGQYDLALTATTPSLQAMANANHQGKVPHVFALVTDPVIAKVGVGSRPLDHPAHLVGIGTLQPVAEGLKLAKQIYPGLKQLGVVWNPAEVNSEVCTRMARDACRDLGIELIEANAENTTSVRDAAASLVSRGVQAIWVGGDVTVIAGLDGVLSQATAAHIPVFSCMPGNAKRGTLFDLGANYYEVGRLAGLLGGKVLHGTSPAKLPVEYIVPSKLFVNTEALKGLRDPWKFPPEMLAKADVLIDDKGVHDKSPRPVTALATVKAKSQKHPPLAKKWRLRVLEYVNIPDAEEAEHGVHQALLEAGLVEGRDFDWKVSNAQGEMPTLNGMVDAAVADSADLIITLSTPTLQAALQRARETPIVFTFLASPLAAGVGKSDTDHAPNATGSYGAGDVAKLVELIPQAMPNAKRIGTMYVPAEVNSVYNHDLFVAAAKKAGYEVEPIGVSTPSDVPDAAVALCSKGVDLIALPASNLVGSSFPSVIQAARRAKIPVFAFLSGMARQGAMVTLARDYHDMGYNAGTLAARVMRGEKPGAIPLEPSAKNRLIFNLDSARECDIVLPAALLKKADVLIGR